MMTSTSTFSKLQDMVSLPLIMLVRPASDMLLHESCYMTNAYAKHDNEIAHSKYDGDTQCAQRVVGPSTLDLLAAALFGELWHLGNFMPKLRSTFDANLTNVASRLESAI